MISLSDRDYQFYDCKVEEMQWNEKHDILTLFCRYMDRSRMKILVSGVRKYEYIQVMMDHVIDYIIPSICEGSNLCYEVHFKQLAETTKIWAKSMELV